MALVLHISDLHLSTASADQVTGDYKVTGLIPLEEQQSRITLLRASLKSLERWLQDKGAELDAIAISGDVSLRFDEAGFKALRETLDALGDKLPEPQRVVVVPGNHDIKRATEPSTPERYEAFIQHVRADGYVTPLLEGVDLDTAGRLLAEPTLPILVGPDSEFLVVAMNSANYSGSVRTLSPDSADRLAALRTKLEDDDDCLQVLDELEDCRKDDVVRISQEQMTGLQTCLAQHPSPAEGGPLRVLVLHHQLLPSLLTRSSRPLKVSAISVSYESSSWRRSSVLCCMGISISPPSTSTKSQWRGILLRALTITWCPRQRQYGARWQLAMSSPD